MAFTLALPVAYAAEQGRHADKQTAGSGMSQGMGVMDNDVMQQRMQKMQPMDQGK